jgi:2-polyprenyl-6-methoxyphenol hydroxylase-like FAD-dependent oxidoreductase
MAAAYILAGELRKAEGDYEEAFARYQQLFRPFVLMKQRVARRFAGLFVPSSAFSLFLRNQVFRILSIDWIADLTAGREFIDRIELPQY